MNENYLKSIDRRLSVIEQNMQTLLIKEANQSGKIHGATIVISLIGSLVITGITLYLKM